MPKCWMSGEKFAQVDRDHGGQRNADSGALKADGSDLEDELRIIADAGVKLEDPEKGMVICFQKSVTPI